MASNYRTKPIKAIFEKINSYYALLGTLHNLKNDNNVNKGNLSKMEQLTNILEANQDVYDALLDSVKFKLPNVSEGKMHYKNVLHFLKSASRELKTEHDFAISGIKGFSKNKLLKFIFEQQLKTGKSEWPTNWYLNAVSKEFENDKGEIEWLDMEKFFLKHVIYRPPGLGNGLNWQMIKKRVVRYNQLCKKHGLPTTVVMSKAKYYGGPLSSK